jgi:hypothetical protein
VRQERVADSDVSFDGDGQRRVNGSHETDVSERQHPGQHVNAAKNWVPRFDVGVQNIERQNVEKYLHTGYVEPHRG